MKDNEFRLRNVIDVVEANVALWRHEAKQKRSRKELLIMVEVRKQK